MSKIGVGIGEDFPVDDGKSSIGGEGFSGADGGYKRDDAQYAEYDARREAYSKWREQRRAWKRQWRDEWRARKRTFRDQVRGSIYENYGRYPRRWAHPFFWGSRVIWGVLALIGLIALIGFAFSHIFFIVGVVALLALFAAYHRGFDPFDLPPRDYSRPTQVPQAPQPPAETPRDQAH